MAPAIRKAIPSRSEEPPPKVYRGAALEAIRCRAPEAITAGPAGTGKSIAWLHKLHAAALKYPRIRAAIVRKTRESLTQSALVTFEQRILGPYWRLRIAENCQRRVRQSYIYPNGSEIVIGGIDKPSKIMSTEFDLIYIQEAIELTESDWESLSSRLRNGMMPYQQLCGDTNPDAAIHWIKRRSEAGLTLLLESRHEDNPLYWDADRGQWTEAGAKYIATLDRLTGVRYLRLRKGLWVGAEGLVYDEWDPATHGVWPEPTPVCDRHVAGMDWGYTNPGVLGVWGIDGDGRATLVREIYRTNCLIGWWVERALEFDRRYGIEAFVCDPSEPAYIQQFRDAGLPAIPGDNAVKPGIQAVKTRLAIPRDGRPRLSIPPMDPREKDETLVAANRPACTHEEFAVYIRQQSNKELPLKENDHGLDQLRYVVAYLDGLGESLETTVVHRLGGTRDHLPGSHYASRTR